MGKISTVVEHKADIGIALDGDGDRLMMADSTGKLYDGDQLLYVIAKHRQAQHQIKDKMHGGVVGTLMTNLAFEHAMQKLGIPFKRAQVGDRYVMELLQQQGWQLGGEFRPHHLSGQTQHRRRDYLRAASAACAASEQTNPGRSSTGFAHVPAGADQCKSK
jgi:phosphoglucosamine mutase